MSDNKNNKNNFKKAVKGGDSVLDKFSPLQVRVINGNFDRALKAFRALVQKERLLSLHKEKSRYEKPSEKRRRKRNEAARKALELTFEKKSAKKSDFSQE